MILTQHNIASATPRNRGRLAKALGLKADASIAALVAACNARPRYESKPTRCGYPCWPGDGPMCTACVERWGQP